MRSKLAPLGFTTILAICLLGHVPKASACSCLQSTDVYLFLPENKQLPAGSNGIWWHGVHHKPLSPGRVQLETLGPGGRWFPRTFTVVQGPGSIVGILPDPVNFDVWGAETHRITIRAYPWEPTSAKLGPVVVSETFTIGSSPLQSGPVGIEIGTPQLVETSAPRGASCRVLFPAVNIRIEPKLPPSLVNAHYGLLFETYVDGQKWRPRRSLCDQFPEGRSRLSDTERPGVDVIYSECPPDKTQQPDSQALRWPSTGHHGLEEGEHEVYVVVSTPDASLRVESTRAVVNLRCDAQAPTSPTPTPKVPVDSTAQTPLPDSPRDHADIPPKHPPPSGRCAVSSDSYGCFGWFAFLLLVNRKTRRIRATESRATPRN